MRGFVTVILYGLILFLPLCGMGSFNMKPFVAFHRLFNLF